MYILGVAIITWNTSSLGAISSLKIAVLGMSLLMLRKLDAIRVLQTYRARARKFNRQSKSLARVLYPKLRLDWKSCVKSSLILLAKLPCSATSPTAHSNNLSLFQERSKSSFLCQSSALKEKTRELFAVSEGDSVVSEDSIPKSNHRQSIPNEYTSIALAPCG